MSDGVVVKEREINGYRFVVRKVPAADQFRLMNRIMNVLGEGVGGVKGMELPTGTDNPFDWLAIIGKVAGSTDPDKTFQLTMDIVSIAKVDIDGNLKDMNTPYFNRVFNDDITGGFKLAAFVLEVQFNDFLTPLLAAFEQASQQETESAPTSGGKLPQAS